ncbi:MAG: T9SS type A sorting domain-containing protein, partial [Candidatus Electryoneaceae bacterium]|nr:T9SS type A sorting domain-containing protein [Candidatus Electryoneaceae bacterium]
PFNGMTRVGFELSEAGWSHLAVYDLNGRLVIDLVEGNLSVGHYNYTVDASSLATGVYILRLQTDAASISQKLVLMK